MTEQSPKGMENMFATLHGAFSNLTWRDKWMIGKIQPRFSFEIVSIDGSIQFYVRTDIKFRDVIEAGIYAQYPDAQISEVEDYASIVPSSFPNEEWNMWGSELALKKSDYLPIRTWDLFEHSLSQELKDPLAVILEQLGCMKPGECFWFQMIVCVSDQDWKEDGVKFIKKIYGLKEETKKSGLEKGLESALSIPSDVLEQTIGVSLLGMAGMGGAAAVKPKDEDMWKAFKITLQEKAQVEGVANKIAKIGFKTKIRMLYFGRKNIYNKGARTAMVKGMLQQYTHQDLNGFSMYGPQTPKDDYFWQRWSYTDRQSRLTRAYKGRSFSTGGPPHILNTQELATLFHFPSVVIKAPLVKKTESRRAEPPVGLPIAFEDTMPSKPVPASTVPLVDTRSSVIPLKKKSVVSVSEPELQVHIPDPIRVLLEPGVELEDVPMPMLPSSEKDEPPSNLPV
jgi:hypothetical protein